jgi:zinc protease
MITTLLAILLTAASLSMGLAQTPEKLVRDRVFLVEDKKANAIEFHMVVLAGCGDEAENNCKGIAHYLEHLVLVGRNAQHGDQAIRFFADGGSNGFTSLKMTRYIHSFPASAPDAAERLDKLFAFYTARLKDFSITDADAERERNVVRQEYDFRYGSSPFWPVWQEVNQFLYPGHALGKWVIGTPKLISSFSLDEARNFHRQWYRLSNAFFIVSGPVTAEQLKAVADRQLGVDARASPPTRVWLDIPPKITPEAREFVKEDARITETTVNVAKTVTFAEHDDLKILAVRTLLNEFLRSKMAGSPHSALVEKAEVASSIQVALIDRPAKGVLVLQLAAVPDTDTPRDRLLEAQRSYLRLFLDQGIDERTLKRLQKRFAQSYAFQLGNPQTAPARLIDWLTVPLPYEKLGETTNIVAGVTIDDVNLVLKAFAGAGREATVIFAPNAGSK